MPLAMAGGGGSVQGRVNKGKRGGGGGGTGWVDGGTPAIVGELGRALVLETNCRKVGLGGGVGGREESDDEVLEGEGELVDELEGLEVGGEARKPLAELEQDVHFYFVASLTQDTDDVQGMEGEGKVHSPIYIFFLPSIGSQTTNLLTMFASFRQAHVPCRRPPVACPGETSTPSAP